jgi:hypothetical protein
MAKAESELYKGLDLRKIKKYGIPVAVLGGATAIFFTAKSFLNDYRDQGEEVMEKLNSQAAITETTRDMEDRGVGITGDPLDKLDKKQPLSSYGSGGDDGWTKIDQDYKAKHPVEKYIKEGAESRNEFPVFIKNYGKDPSMLKKFEGSYFTYPTEEMVNSKYGEEWIIMDIKYKRKDGKEIYRRFLCAKSKNGWFPADFGPPIE